MISFHNDWDHLLAEEFQKDYYQNLRKILIHEYKTQTVYPDMYDIYQALKLTPYHDVKVVLLGQDPYHGPNQAHGLSFSVKKGVKIPPSLQNIFKELKNDLGCNPPENGDLTKWGKQGVLLLNATLTVRAGQPNSHQSIGWELLTNQIVSLLDQREKPMVFLLWGANAKKKQALIKNPSHLVLTSAHPSPFSANYGFFGCRHFSKTNMFLEKNGISPIDWNLANEK